MRICQIVYSEATGAPRRIVTTATIEEFLAGQHGLGKGEAAILVDPAVEDVLVMGVLGKYRESPNDAQILALIEAKRGKPCEPAPRLAIIDDKSGEIIGITLGDFVADQKEGVTLFEHPTVQVGWEIDATGEYVDPAVVAEAVGG